MKSEELSTSAALTHWSTEEWFPLEHFLTQPEMMYKFRTSNIISIIYHLFLLSSEKPRGFLLSSLAFFHCAYIEEPAGTIKHFVDSSVKTLEAMDCVTRAEDWSSSAHLIASVCDSIFILSLFQEDAMDKVVLLLLWSANQSKTHCLLSVIWWNH